MKKTEIVATIIFVFLIFALPITQAVSEVRSGKRIQVFDLFEDTFATPIRRAQTMNALLTRIQARADSIAAEIARAGADSAAVWDSQQEQSQTDEAMVDAAELKKTALTYNRHVKVDPASKPTVAISLYLAGFDTLLAHLRAGDKAAAGRTIAAIRESTGRMAVRYRRPGALDDVALIVKNLPVIFWNAKYLRPFEKEIENTSIFTTATRPVMFFVRYALYRDLGEKGVLGKNCWFFYKQDVDYLIRPYVLDKRALQVDPNDQVVSDNPVRAAATFKKQLAGFGVDLLMVIVPGKPSIYPDMLAPGADPELVTRRGNSLKAIADLRAAGVDVVDLFAPFLAERGNDRVAGDSLYLSKDTHWKTRAVRIAARVVADRVKRYPWYVPGTAEYAVDSVSIDRVGDVGTMTTIPAFRVNELALTFPVEKTKCYQVYSVERDAGGNETGRHLYKDDFKNSRIILLGDSYSRIYQSDEPRSAGWISHIALELSQPITSLVSDGGASTLVRESLARKVGLLKGKKLVIWEIVERDFRYGNEGWKDIPLQVAEK
jgi:hypothetical protein